MKKISIFIISVLFSFVLSAQNGSESQKFSLPHLNYLFELDSADYPSIDSTGTPISFDDWDVGYYNLDLTGEFSFTYNKRTYSVFTVSVNGALGLGADVEIKNQNALGNEYNAPLVAPLWDDMEFPDEGAYGRPYYQIEINGNDTILIVEWYNIIKHFTSSEYGIAYQVRLHSEKDVIEFYYLDMDDMVNFTQYMHSSIGLNDTVTVDGIPYANYVSILPGNPILVDYENTHDDINKDSLLTIQNGTVYRFMYAYPTSFKVMDTAGNLIDSAMITVNNQTLYTDSTGQVSTNLIEDTYTAITTKEGYHSDTLNFNIYKDTTFTIILEPISYAINFTVTDTADNVIEGATISVADQTLTTDANGQASISLVNGDYTAITTKDGYYSDSLNFSVNSADASLEIILIPFATSINNHNKIIIYPNPASNIINITDACGYYLTINDLNGKTILIKSVDKSNEIIDISKFKAGIYIVNLKKETQNLHYKVIIQ